MILAIIAILTILAINGRILFSAVNTDFFGILVSLCLFVIGGRKTTFQINYLLFALILIIEFVSYRLNTKSVHFLAIILLLCLVLHYFTGKFSFIAFICIILFSTLFSTFFNHLTAEIKQTLCYAVYQTLKNFIQIDKIEGVNFYIDNAKITIDTACMGLSMFKTGLLTGAVLMTSEERKQKQYYGILQIFLFCFLIIILNIISNYFRIITLVIFNCTTENALHHSIGLVCFMAYQIIPMLVLIKYIKPKLTDNNFIKTKSEKSIVTLSFLVLLAVSLKINNVKNNDFQNDVYSNYVTKKGTWVNNEVFKIEMGSKLTYIKTPSHNPLICWTGNGYTITESKKILIDKQEIWLNKMEKDTHTFNSYWWYECGNKKYTSLVEVLFIKLIYNKPIFLINETTKTN